MDRFTRALTGRLPARVRGFARRLLTRDFELLLAALVIGVAAWGFLALADEVGDGATRQIDERLMRALRDPQDPADALGPGWFEDAMRDLTALGGNAVLTLGTLAVVLFLLIRRQYHAAILVVAASLGGLILMAGLKELFARPRPSVVPHLVRVRSPSFPSGHAMTSAVIYLTLAALLARLLEERRVKVYVVTVALALTFLIGVTRVYLGVHYPTDVVAGWTVGLAWAVFCGAVALFLQRRGKVERPHETTDQTMARDASEGS